MRRTRFSISATSRKSADYSEKWNKEHEELDAHLNTLEQVTTLPADKEVGARHTRRPLHLHDRLPVGRAADFREDDQVSRGRQRRNGAVQGRHPPHGYRARRIRREKRRAHECEREGRARLRGAHPQHHVGRLHRRNRHRSLHDRRRHAQHHAVRSWRSSPSPRNWRKGQSDFEIDVSAAATRPECSSAR